MSGAEACIHMEQSPSQTCDLYIICMLVVNEMTFCFAATFDQWVTGYTIETSSDDMTYMLHVISLFILYLLICAHPCGSICSKLSIHVFVA